MADFQCPYIHCRAVESDKSDESKSLKKSKSRKKSDKVRKVGFDFYQTFGKKKYLIKGNVQKPQSRLCAVMGGGVPPLAVIFFPLTFWPVACRDGGGGTPLCRDFFPLIFWPAACRDGGRGRGGYPHHGTKP